jgi:hypothetical protein
VHGVDLFKGVGNLENRQDDTHRNESYHSPHDDDHQRFDHHGDLVDICVQLATVELDDVVEGVIEFSCDLRYLRVRRQSLAYSVWLLEHACNFLDRGQSLIHFHKTVFPKCAHPQSDGDVP